MRRADSLLVPFHLLDSFEISRPLGRGCLFESAHRVVARKLLLALSLLLQLPCDVQKDLVVLGIGDLLLEGQVQVQRRGL